MGRLGGFGVGVGTTVAAAAAIAFGLFAGPDPAPSDPPSRASVQAESERERGLRASLLDALAQRARTELGNGADRANLDVLLLSGGAQYGAFAAGVLEGWAASDELPRPHFDLVTGVSAGAMLATSAFIDRGEVYGSRVIEELFVRAREAWSLDEPTAYLPWRASLLDPDPLRQAIAQSTPSRAVRRVAEEAREGRKLLVMATNIELGRPSVWDLTALAASDEEGSEDAYRARVLASASLPPLFPPVDIEGALHADGGASHLFFLGPRFDLLDDLHRRLDDAGIATRTRIRVWIIVSSPLWPTAASIPRRWARVTYRVATLGLYALTRADLQRVHRAVQRVASRSPGIAELRFMAVPTGFERDQTLAGPDFVRRLRTTGKQMGRSGDWRREPAAAKGDGG
jgi:hypothetical protein